MIKATLILLFGVGSVLIPFAIVGGGAELPALILKTFFGGFFAITILTVVAETPARHVLWGGVFLIGLMILWIQVLRFTAT
jgi:hypothetical protein